MLLNCYSYPNKPISAKPIRMSQIDTQKFQECLPDPLELFEQITAGTDNVCSIITEALHSACKSSAHRTTDSNVQTRTADLRWKTLVELGDPKKIRKAIDWNGMFTKQPQDKDTSSDETFAEYFTHLLNPTDTDELIDHPSCSDILPSLRWSNQ